jgi:gamma-glutamylputrescine oxidase
MNLLHANDRAGEYPPSWYAATSVPAPDRPALAGDCRADVCIVGAGFTGLSAALHLAQAGVRVVVLEAHRAGWGASGRNGGQVGSGQRLDQDWIEAHLPGDARTLWDMAEAAKALVQGLAAGMPGVDWRPGIVHALRKTPRWPRAPLCRKAGRDYGYARIDPLDRASSPR